MQFLSKVVGWLLWLVGVRSYVLRVTGAHPSKIALMNGIKTGRLCHITVGRRHFGSEGPSLEINGEETFTPLQITRDFGVKYTEAHYFATRAPHVRIGKYLRVPASVVEAWAEKRTAPTHPELPFQAGGVANESV